MECLAKTRFILLVAALLGLPAAANAQYPFRAFGGGYFGNYGGYGFGTMGGYGFGGPGAFSYGPFSGFGYGYPGYLAPFGGAPGIYSPYYGSGGMYSSPYNLNGYNRSVPMIYPGFGASEMPRSRPTVYPAIPEPSQPIILAALASDDKDKARIDLHVPTADAKVYLDGTLTRQAGLDRSYVTPKLAAGKRYAFKMEVVWEDESGMRRTVTRQLRVRAGETTSVNLRDDDE